MSTASYRYNFTNDKDSEFVRTLRNRVNEYFKTNNISRYANANMVIKSIVMFSIYIVPMILMLVGVVSNPWFIFGLWIIMGFGKSGIGMCVMHDANHGAYSRNKIINRFMSYSMNLIGASNELWKIQHNVLHHTFTNIEGADEDIQPMVMFRFSPYQNKLWIHRYQHIYAWFFYSLMTIAWMTIKNFQQIFRYRKNGLIKTNRQFKIEFAKIILWKVFYYGYILVLPMILLPISPVVILVGFLIMHLIAGSVLSVIFQTAHVMPSIEFPKPNKEHKIDENWVVHQMAATTNYATNSKIFSWLIGGLNLQVEHHLFSNICHVHYRKISQISSETAKEFNIVYNKQKSFPSAVWNHVRMLRELGRMDKIGDLVT